MLLKFLSSLELCPIFIDKLRHMQIIYEDGDFSGSDCSLFSNASIPVSNCIDITQRWRDFSCIEKW